MNNFTRESERQVAFRMYAEGKKQKEIAIHLGVSQNSVTAWKKENNWKQKLQVQEQTKIADAYLLVSEYIRQDTNEKTNAGIMKLEDANMLNNSLTVIYQTLKDNYLV